MVAFRTKHVHIALTEIHLLFRQGGFDYFHFDNYILILRITISRNKSAIFIILFSRNSFLSLIFLRYEFPRQEILKPITLFVCIGNVYFIYKTLLMAAIPNL